LGGGPGLKTLGKGRADDFAQVLRLLFGEEDGDPVERSGKSFVFSPYPGSELPRCLRDGRIDIRRERQRPPQFAC
jgi:hypothetical protein